MNLLSELLTESFKQKINESPSDLSVSYEARFIPKIQGMFGNCVVIEGKPAKMIASMLKINDNWKLVKLDAGWAAYDGVRITFFEKEQDFEPERD